MSLFVCSKCKCVENTNLRSPSRDRDKSFPNIGVMEMHGIGKDEEKIAPRFLCSGCNTGKWHGEFEKRPATDVEIAMAKSQDGNCFSFHRLYREYVEDPLSVTVSKVKISDAITGTVRGIKADPFTLREPLCSGMKWEKSKPYEREVPKISRNAPCFCGSGKKYKKCCIYQYL